MSKKDSLKLRMYEHIYRLNRDVEDVLEDMKALQELHGFPRRFLRACKGRVEQLRAEVNRELTQAFSMCEAGDSAHFANFLAQMQRPVTGRRDRRVRARGG